MSKVNNEDLPEKIVCFAGELPHTYNFLADCNSNSLQLFFEFIAVNDWLIQFKVRKGTFGAREYFKVEIHESNFGLVDKCVKYLNINILFYAN